MARLPTTYEVEYRWADPDAQTREGRQPQTLCTRRFNGSRIAERKARAWVERGILDGVVSGPGLPNRSADIYRRKRIDTIGPEGS